MEALWESNGDPMEIQCKSNRNPTETLGKSNGNLVEILWKAYGSPKEIRWKSFGNSVSVAILAQGNSRPAPAFASTPALPRCRSHRKQPAGFQFAETRPSSYQYNSQIKSPAKHLHSPGSAREKWPGKASRQRSGSTNLGQRCTRSSRLPSARAPVQVLRSPVGKVRAPARKTSARQ